MKLPSGPAQSAFSYWRRQFGHRQDPAFDQDDAAQEIRLALWKDPEATTTILYRRVIDAMRKLDLGFRMGKQLAMVRMDSVDLPEIADHLTPERICAARQQVDKILALPESDQKCLSASAFSACGGKTPRAAAKIERLRQQLFPDGLT